MCIKTESPRLHFPDVDVAGGLEDGRGLPLDQAVVEQGRLRHRRQVVVAVSTGINSHHRYITSIYYNLTSAPGNDRTPAS